MKPATTWQVLSHGELSRLADNLYTVEGTFKVPIGDSGRRMTIARAAGNRLAVFSAIALAEPEMARIEALGTPTWLIVPNGFHRLDIRPWKDRYPALQVIAPAGAVKLVQEVVPVDATAADFGDPGIQLATVPGTRDREFALVVDTGTGRTLVLNDVVFNLPAERGLKGLLLKLVGFGPGRPALPKIVIRNLVADRAAFAAQLRAWADMPRLERVLVSHGDPLPEPRETLHRLASAVG